MRTLAKLMVKNYIIHIFEGENDKTEPQLVIELKRQSQQPINEPKIEYLRKSLFLTFRKEQ